MVYLFSHREYSRTFHCALTLSTEHYSLEALITQPASQQTSVFITKPTSVCFFHNTFTKSLLTEIVLKTVHCSGIILLLVDQSQMKVSSSYSNILLHQSSWRPIPDEPPNVTKMWSKFFRMVCRLVLYTVKINTHYDQLSLLLYPQNIQHSKSLLTSSKLSLD